jgi:protein-S-isoprenylcysteine O-methyltransferase Ste14
MKKRLKINGIIITLACFSIAFFPTFFLRVERGGVSGLIDLTAEIFGVALILLGQILRVSARGYKAEHSQEGLTLIQDGPYSLVRNPMYLGILLIGLGIMLMLFEWWVACLFLFFFAIRYLLLILKEEKTLSSRFSADYRVYCQKVPRILPFLPAIFKMDISACLPLKLRWLKKEIGPILTVLFVTFLLESWEDIKSQGIRAYFKEAAGMFVVIILFVCLIVYLSRRTENEENRPV